MVPRGGLGFREEISLSINELASPAEAVVYHVCGAGFNARPPPERSTPNPNKRAQSVLGRTSSNYIGIHATPLAGTGLHR